MKKILITGITGLLGSYLAKSYAGKAQISGLKRQNSSTQLLGNLASQINWYEGEITDVELLIEACNNQDLVIHAAGMVSFDESKKEALLETNTQGTACMVNAMLSSSCKKLVFISSVAALGRDAIPLINENQKWVTSPLNTPYAISKHLAELEVWRGAQEGLEVMVFNPSILLAKIGDERSSSQIYRYVLEGNRYFPIGDINYIDIRDAVSQINTMIDSGHWGQRYIINKEAIPYETFFKEMAKEFKLTPPKKPLNNWMAKMVINWSMLYNYFAKNKIPVTRQTIKTAQSKIRYDNNKINTITEYTYTPLTDTFKWAISVN
ncbi:NAD-dependent epimerase/dehydratase family protein [Cyclobacterium sp. 1_MG-2023]|uniref:NAD-dependent epimerase/dehydratase family protein n=1 Tax=Cyclobacterium sp. 1_MG-2023 TaxID=3062681 RepID=UPI0026E1F3CC|nr:NAD-dependent epimerase/dehydratase family protein [Cyclobacterium sp. 1_MG-2023]MDO6440020.1 NAD-dependent epimerase/dehydratase family protein [Cyclobacterium sp. 1_MG-2023]